MRTLRLLTLLLPLFLAAQRPVPVNNTFARVVIATSSPGPKGNMHKHDVNRVMIYLDKGSQRIEYEDGLKRDISFGPGDAKWDPKGGMHTSENTGGTTFRVVEIELKQDGSSVQQRKPDSLKVVPRGFKVELENDQVRVLRVKLAARQVLQRYELVLPRIIVPLTDIDLRTGDAASMVPKPPQAIYDDAPNSRLENALNQSVEFLLVELKR